MTRINSSSPEEFGKRDVVSETSSEAVERSNGFTAGPWHVYCGEDREAIAISKFVDGDNGGTTGKGIARMPVPHAYGPINSRNTQSEINANARLIAAAPDLFEVVEAMSRWDGRNNTKAIKDMARAAIAKALAQ